MTEPSTLAKPLTTTPSPCHPHNVLLNLIVTLLTPMFLMETGGDLTFARMAALETLNEYRAHTQMELIAVAQIIAFGLAALGSLALSMADDTPPLMMLRWRCNANALNRSAEQNRRALERCRSAATGGGQTGNAATDYRNLNAAAGSDIPLDDAQAQYETEVMAELARTRTRVAASNARVHAASKAAPTDLSAPQAPTAAAEPAPAPQYTAPVPPIMPASAEPANMPAPAEPATTLAPIQPAIMPAPALTAPTQAPVLATHPLAATQAMTDEDRHRAFWAAALSGVAEEFSAEMADLPPHEREAAIVQIAALSSSANALLSGDPMPSLQSAPSPITSL
ncbi:hypothetical protein [Rhodopila sp.]|uniref:hypothetical protein n=1 Tax=Rhodopila sp. TaxID=2480087 RepID=UPI003D097D47